MRCDKKDLLLYAVTDRAWLGDKTLAWQVEESLKGGSTMIQLREKHLDEDTFHEEALELQALCRRYGVPFLINDDVELAVAVNADGVHVGQSDMEAGDVRITFDKDVRGAFPGLPMFDAGLVFQHVLEPGKLVLEVKFTEFLPRLVQEALPLRAAERSAVSKYTLCCDKVNYLTAKISDQ